MIYSPENMKLMNGKQVLFGGKQLEHLEGIATVY